MAESIVSFVATSLGNLVIEEATFLKGVSQLVKQIEIELKRVQCFLKEADKRQNEDESIQNWVSEIREAVYNVQDVIETFALEIASRTKKIHSRGMFLSSKAEKFTRISNLTRSLQTSLQIDGVNVIKEDDLGSAFD
ncbi:putative disease resistance protein At1g50180 [Fagus crenata]